MTAKKFKDFISETAMLDKYLSTKGVNPKYATMQVKVAHSKTNAFKKWQKDHYDSIKKKELQQKGSLQLNGESVEQIDEISKDLANQYMYAAQVDRRETTDKIIKTQDKQTKQWSKIRHNKISKLLDREGKRTRGIHKALDRLSQEAVEQIDELNRDTLYSYEKKSHKDSDKQHEIIGKSIMTGDAKVGNAAATKAISRLRGLERANKRLAKEATEADYGGQHHANVLALKAKAEKKPVDMASLAARMQASYKKDEKKPAVKEEIEQIDEISKEKLTTYKKWSSMNAVGHASNIYDREVEGGQKPDAKMHHKLNVRKKGIERADARLKEETEQLDESRKKELSKSARMIKALYKKHGMVKEEMHDRDKSEKQEAPYGKSPKHDKADPKEAHGENKPKAAAVLTGGTTLTGEKRDDIEIDPMMRARPGQPDPTKKKDGDKDKDDKKKDK